MHIPRRGRGAGRRLGLVVGLVGLFGSYAEAAHAQQCMPSTVVSGVDLDPDGDGTLGWSAAYSAGTHFAIIKATQGNYYTDSDFSDNWAALKAAGVVRGAYHFFDATVDGATQASYFLNVMGTLDPGDLPPTLDIECPVSGESDCLGNGNSGAATGAQITTVMNDFLNAVEAATGVKPIVYSYGSWFSDNGVDTTGLQAYPLWIADYSYTSCFNVPSPWTTATIWQFNSTGSVGGVNADSDYFLGSMAQLSAFTAGTGGGHAMDAGIAPPPDDAGSDEDAGVPCTVTTTGDMGICMLTSSCSEMGGTATPDYCPGPDDIQCCTGIAAPPDAGKPSSSSNSASSGGGASTASTAGGGTATSTVGGGSAGSTGGGGVTASSLPGGTSSASTGGVISGAPSGGSGAATARAGSDAGPDGGEFADGGSSGGCAIGPAGPRGGLTLPVATMTVLWAVRRRRRGGRTGADV